MKLVILFFLQQTFAAQTVVPSVHMDFWNDSRRIGLNNCYNYGTNRATDSFAQPGEASRVELNDYDCPLVLAAASQDLGVRKAAFFPFQKKKDEMLIALVVSPGSDFHWYRRGDDGMWSHKLGSSPATTLDNSGLPIADPEKADRGFYTEFCGYFRVKNYVYRSDEQNGGYVRIGNMGKLPSPPHHSELVVLMYSGRRNPSYPLQEQLQDEVFKNALMEVRDQLSRASVASEWHIDQMSKLGYTGFMIVDREGLVFPAGSRVQIWDKQVLAYLPGKTKPVYVLNPRAVRFKSLKR